MARRLRKVFKFALGIVGLEVAEETIRLYCKTIDTGRADVDSILECEIKDALDIVKG